MIDLNIAVLMGGDSQEASVSRSSANEVAKALTQVGHNCSLLELDDTLVTQLLNDNFDVVFPVLHGPPGEDGTVQGLLEMLHLPYVGSDVAGCAFAMDKSVSKQLFRRIGLPVADDLVFNRQTPTEKIVDLTLAEFGECVVIKPLRQGSAIGVTPLPNGGDLLKGVQDALVLGDIMIEPFVMGQEATVGVLDLHLQDQIALPSIEIRTPDEQWYDFRNRYTVGQSEHIIPAPYPDSTNTELTRIALEAHTILGLRDLSRADFIVTDQESIILLEVNAMPGMTPTSLFPDGARAAGYSFEQLVDALVASAFEREKLKA